MAAAPVTAAAQAADPEVFSLGEIVVTARDARGDRVGGARLEADDLRRFQKTTLDQALALAPGVNAAPTGGSRNEALVFVRGFDRFQTTLSIDGVRVFLPSDNRIDFARFLTADLAAIQISKGYVSVLDGPGALGGAINLVTVRPTGRHEAEVRLGTTLDGEGSGVGRQASARVGGAGERFYLQASGAWSRRDAFTLSEDFQPTLLEDGGARENSESRDWRINLKAGFTPRGDDEYSLSYTRQEGEKNAPYHVTDTASRRYWRWPEWNLDSLYLLTRTELRGGAELSTRLYRNRFDNALFAYDDAQQTRQTLPRAFRSYYDDTATGGNVSLGLPLVAATRLTLAAYVRRDRHVETQTTFAPALIEPDQTSEEDTWSLAGEITRSLGPDVDLIVGVARDWRDLRRAEDFSAGALVRFPLEDDAAWQGQAALVWRPAAGWRLRASASSRTRFPTLFERFSSRLGTAVPNPGLTAERALNVELGAEWAGADGATFSGAVFRSEIDDALIQTPVLLAPPFGLTQQTRNVGRGEILGLELAGSVPLGDRIALAGHWTWTDRDFVDPANPAFRPLGVPDHKVFARLDWKATDRLTVTPNVEATSDRWTVTSSSAVTPARYYRTGGVVLVGLTAAWAVTDRLDLVAGGANLLDETYTLVDGFPEEGRRLFVDLRFRL
ncbi:TonB-dependent receptor [Brevundimonas sp.]|uniref:TonB-dependent receptor plug domain-containing protein n=1 Tax=Brevundimonas sp. TaxID=1871086 RepID=UPI00260546E1|nr:TonB-dependent receptor [Brevundimonas sp.]